MKTFKQYLKEGRSRGEAMEEVIVAAVNGKPQGDDKYGLDADAGVKVANFLKKNNHSGKAKVLGADTIDVSKTWSQFWNGKVPASTKTPKTDFMVGKSKISLKSGDAAQLMSGGKNESVATFYAALDKSKGTMQDDMVNKLKSMFENLAPASVASSNLKDVIKSQKDEVVNKANKAHKELMSELKGIFDKNESFRNAFAYEAMSGEVKFGGNIGACSHFLVTSFDGNNVKIHSVNDETYVAKIAKQMKTSVRFKTTSVKRGGKKTGEYRYWSVIGLIVDKMQEDIDHMINNGDMLTESMVKDFFARVWKRIKSFFLKAIEYVKKNVKNLFDFLEVEPIISFNNNVKF